LLDTRLIVLHGGTLSMTFTLPHGFLEFQDTSESPTGAPPLAASLLAEIHVGINSAGIIRQISLFGLDATLSGNFHGQRLTVNASSIDPSLDLSSFHAAAQTTVSLDQRTVHWEYPTFTGTLPISGLQALDEVLVSYTLDARVQGLGTLNEAAAAINDPFFFDTDPVTQVAPIVIADDQVAAVGEPGTLALLGIGLAGLARRQRCRSSRCASATSSRAADNQVRQR
jgi:hypothetical protein